MSNSSTSDRSARFLSLLQPIEGELECYARRMVWRREDVPDALQNAVLRAFSAFDRYREDASFRAWIYRILTNEISTINRRHTRAERPAEPAEIDALEALENAAAHTDWLASPEALREALDDDIVTALDDLTENERAVLLLRAIGGFHYHEMAETLEIPMGSVMGHLSRARHKMREALRRKTKNTSTRTP